MNIALCYDLLFAIVTVMESEDEQRERTSSGLKTISSWSSEDLIAGIPRSVSPSVLHSADPSPSLHLLFAKCACVSNGADHSRKRSTSRCQPPTVSCFLEPRPTTQNTTTFKVVVFILPFPKFHPVSTWSFLVESLNRLLSPNPIDPITLPAHLNSFVMRVWL